jgi:ribosome-binding protein aMBF1 (putative translation factor)
MKVSYTVNCKKCGAEITGITQIGRVTGYVCYQCKTQYYREKARERLKTKRTEINKRRRENYKKRHDGTH